MNTSPSTIYSVTNLGFKKKKKNQRSGTSQKRRIKEKGYSLIPPCQHGRHDDIPARKNRTSHQPRSNSRPRSSIRNIAKLEPPRLSIIIVLLLGRNRPDDLRIKQIPIEHLDQMPHLGRLQILTCTAEA